MKKKAYVWVAVNNDPGYEPSYRVYPRPPVNDHGYWYVVGSPRKGTKLCNAVIVRAGCPEIKPGGGPVKCELILKPVKEKKA